MADSPGRRPRRTRRTRTSAGPTRRDAEPTEELLVRWSRRVKITYLGVYDTVGAVGWDALAIPGIRSRLALHHNMRPTTLIQQCRHALAIDEHRSNFRHTPFVAYISPDIRRGELETASNRSATRAEAAHSDPVASLAIGVDRRGSSSAGSSARTRTWAAAMPSNPLAQQPLAWLLDGARRGRPDLRSTSPRSCRRRSAASDLATRSWNSPNRSGRRSLRAKRVYRMIDPDPEIRADAAAPQEQPGFMLVNINEHVDRKRRSATGNRRSDPPPNLVEYAKRQVAASP